MMWSLPIAVNIGGTEYKIRDNCDYRVILDVIEALNDNDLEMKNRFECALFIFYGNEESLKTPQEVIAEIEDIQTAIKEMMKIINLGEEIKEEHKPKLMDWKHDFKNLAPPISRVLGYSVREVNNYTHWYDFIGAYMEIGKCVFSIIVSIREKRLKGEKMEKWEQEFYRENRKIIDLPQKLTAEEEEFLSSD